MKNTQLRNGNYILHNGGVKTIDGVVRGHVCFVEEVTQKFEQDYYGPWASLDEVDFIPITADWLIETGFEKANDMDCWYKIRLINDWSFLFINPKHKMAEISISKHGCVLSFGGNIHELQNLYYALTKQELCAIQP